MPNVKRKWPWQGSLRSRPERREQDLLPAPETTHSSSDESRPAPTRWVSEGQSDLSPYGFAEDDAGLRQVESGAWRRAFSGGGQSRTPHKQFVPMSSARTRPSPVKPNKPSYFSRTIVWQTFCALVLVGVVYYVDHHPDAVPPEVVSQTQAVLQTDYTADVAPSIDKAFADMHISAPQFDRQRRLNFTIRSQAPLLRITRLRILRSRSRGRQRHLCWQRARVRC